MQCEPRAPLGGGRGNLLRVAGARLAFGHDVVPSRSCSREYVDSSISRSHVDPSLLCRPCRHTGSDIQIESRRHSQV